MSSHHIVREAQEPALLLWEAESLAGDQLSQLLEWSPTILTREESLEAVLAQEIKVDAVVCTPGQEADIRRKAAAQSHVQFIPAASAEEVLSAALLHLAKQGQQAINIVAEPTTAETYLLPVLVRQTLLPIVVILCGWEKWSLYRNGSFTKWLPAKEKVWVQAAQPGLSLSSKGFAKDLQEAVSKKRVLLHTLESGTKKIWADGPFWVGEELS